VASARVTDRIFRLIRSISLQKPDSTGFDFPSPEEFTGPEAESEMTAAEMECAKINLGLLKVVTFMSGSKSVTSDDVDGSLAQAEKWLGSKLKSFSLESNSVSPTSSNTAICLRKEAPSAPSWRYLHEMFLALESLKAISLITSHASKKGSKTVKIAKDRVDRLADLTRQVHESIRANTRTLKSRISESGVLGDLIELVLSGPDGGERGKHLRSELEKTLDLPALELFCGSLMESWEEGLNGVLEVSL
jgi:N-terminal acetyltransferase B complex non-catalytic subunit